MVLNKNIHKYDKLEKKIRDKERKNIFSFLDAKTYRQLWEEQNVQLDEQKLRLHRKDKEIKKLELKVEKLETEITNLKARRRAKKAK